MQGPGVKVLSSSGQRPEKLHRIAPIKRIIPVLLVAIKFNQLNGTFRKYCSQVTFSPEASGQKLMR